MITISIYLYILHIDAYAENTVIARCAQQVMVRKHYYDDYTFSEIHIRWTVSFSGLFQKRNN